MKTLACLAALLALATGCARDVRPDPLALPPDESVRAQFGRVAVMAADSDATARLDGPVVGPLDGAGYGAIVGAFIGFQLFGTMMRDSKVNVGGSSGAELLALFFLVITAIAVSLIPVGTVFGALWGAGAAPSSAEIEAALRDLQRAVVEERLHPAVADDIRKLALASDDVPWADADTLLEIGAPGVELRGPWKVDPPLQLRVTLPFRLVRTKDGATLHADRFSLDGASKTLAEWSSGRGAPLRAELAKVRETASRRIVDHVFHRTLLPVDRRPDRRKL